MQWYLTSVVWSVFVPEIGCLFHLFDWRIVLLKSLSRCKIMAFSDTYRHVFFLHEVKKSQPQFKSLSAAVKNLTSFSTSRIPAVRTFFHFESWSILNSTNLRYVIFFFVCELPSFVCLFFVARISICSVWLYRDHDF